MQFIKNLFRALLLHRAPSNDFVGYEVLIDFLKERSLHRLDGDLVEIGSFMGGGTAKLARYARKHGKCVYAVDIFEPGADTTETDDGVKMCDIYEAFREGHPQVDVYRQTTRGLTNIVTIAKDSKTVSFPIRQRFMFGFIDGNHQPDYVRNDFGIIWPNLVAGGVLGFHDYNFGLPEVTACINKLINEYAGEISEVFEIQSQHIILLVKKQNGSND